MNKNPTWKYLLLLFIVAFGVIYATPNLYPSDPGLQIVGARTAEVDNSILERVKNTLDSADITVKTISLEDGKVRARLSSEADQTKGQDILKKELGELYPVALADMTTTPDWLQSLGGAPMYLGLDLRGGVHFLMQVDMAAVEKKSNDDYYEDIRKSLREEGLRSSGIVQKTNGAVSIRFSTEEVRNNADLAMGRRYQELDNVVYEEDGKFMLDLQVTEAELDRIRDSALRKNMLALRNRIDQLGVSEPVIQRQGNDRIVVQLPGVKDPSIARDILGKTATLEVRLVDEDNQASNARGRVPTDSARFYFRDGQPIILKKRVLYSGENIIDATAGSSQEDGSPIVNITLDAQGAAVNSDVTGKNIGNRMAVVYVETIAEKEIDENGNQVVLSSKEVREVITAPRIITQLPRRYVITGLDSPKEAQNIALLLRAGSLAAPLYIIEERTVGPSLGAENISKGFSSVLYGFLAVLVFMIIFYRVFGAVASFALVLNLVIIVGVLSLLQATLTLPGVAGMVLTVGMAVDANVLIFERIREEIRDGAPPQMAIHRGYDNAFSTIIDANLTTLIAALVLFNFGTGPIRGFAITLSIGIATSMITAIFASRVLVNLFYGNRRLEKLSM